MKKKNYGYILLPLFLSLGIIGGLFIGRYSSEQRMSPGEEKLRTVLGMIQGNSVITTTENDL